MFKSGIYKFEIKKPKGTLYYIGSSVNVFNRHTQHLKSLEKGDHFNPRFQYIFDKYGKDCLSFQILEFCNKRYLLETEQEYLDYSNWEQLINICRFSGSGSGNPRNYTVVSPNGKIYNGTNLKQFCRDLDLDYSRILNLVRIDSKCNHSQGWTRSIKEHLEWKKKYTICLQKIGTNEVFQFFSKKEAGEYLNISKSHLSQLQKGKRQTVEGYKLCGN